MSTRRQFSSAQVTVMIVAAILAFIPGTLLAVDPFTNVAIQDPVSGQKATVSTANRLQVSGVASADLVTISAAPGMLTCSVIYVVPAGKTLIVESVVVTEQQQPSSWAVTLYSAAGCGGSSAFAAVSSEAEYDTINLDLGSGVAVREGRRLSAFVDDELGFATIFVYGRLTPTGS